MTIGTLLFTWLRGERVGEDAFANVYYRQRGGARRNVGGLGVERRWVIYKGEPEASKVPPEWNAWLHHTVDEPPVGPRPKRPWQKDHVPNLTGTAEAYRPRGHVLRGARRDSDRGGYEPWRPD